MKQRLIVAFAVPGMYVQYYLDYGNSRNEKKIKITDRTYLWHIRKNIKKQKIRVSTAKKKKKKKKKNRFKNTLAQSHNFPEQSWDRCY